MCLCVRMYLWSGRGCQSLYIANVGDCRVVLCQAGKEVVLTEDHRPGNADEAKRVRAAGGMIDQYGYLNGVLGITRAIGPLRPFPYHQPLFFFIEFKSFFKCPSRIVYYLLSES